MAKIECYINPKLGVKYRVSVIYKDNSFTYSKSNTKWDYAFNIVARNPLIIEYDSTSFPTNYKKAIETYIKDLERTYKLIKRVRHAKVVFVSSGFKTCTSSGLQLEVFVVE